MYCDGCDTHVEREGFLSASALARERARYHGMPCVAHVTLLLRQCSICMHERAVYTGWQDIDRVQHAWLRQPTGQAWQARVHGLRVRDSCNMRMPCAQ